MADPGADPVALPIVPCPDCGRNVVTYVARRGQNAGERFYKCSNHNMVRLGNQRPISTVARRLEILMVKVVALPRSLATKMREKASSC